MGKYWERYPSIPLPPDLKAQHELWDQREIRDILLEDLWWGAECGEREGQEAVCSFFPNKAKPAVAGHSTPPILKIGDFW